jgi:hypothetical protein
VQVLQRVELEHDVEAVVLEQAQAVLEVELQHAHVAPDALGDQAVVDLDADAAAAALVAQQGQEGAAAAAEVEHAAPARHALGDVGQAVAGVHHRPRAMLSKYARIASW